MNILNKHITKLQIFLALVLTTVIVLSATITVFAKGITFSSRNSINGNDINISISVSDNSNISALTMEFYYDSSQLSYKSYSASKLLDNGIYKVNDTKDGKLILAYVSMDSLLDGGELLTINLTLKENADERIKTDIVIKEVADKDGNNISHNVDVELLKLDKNTFDKKSSSKNSNSKRTSDSSKTNSNVSTTNDNGSDSNLEMDAAERKQLGYDIAEDNSEESTNTSETVQKNNETTNEIENTDSAVGKEPNQHTSNVSYNEATENTKDSFSKDTVNPLALLIIIAIIIFTIAILFITIKRRRKK